MGRNTINKNTISPRLMDELYQEHQKSSGSAPDNVPDEFARMAFENKAYSAFGKYDNSKYSSQNIQSTETPPAPLAKTSTKKASGAINDNYVVVTHGVETTNVPVKPTPLPNNYVEVIDGSESSYHQVQDNSKLGLPNL